MLERVWKKGKPPSLLVGGVNWYNYFGELYGGSLKTKNKLPYNPAIL